jgi:hypothetical protein
MLEEFACIRRKSASPGAIARRIMLTLVAILAVCNLCSSSEEETWFSQRVTWSYGKEGLPWKTTIKNPNGPGQYLLVLRPLWALEGGVVALEIVVASPSQPDVNILGKRKNGVASPFVITVGELQKGLARSKFEATRMLQADGVAVDVKIEHFRLGEGVGSLSTYCADCKNLQELSMWITVKSAGKAAHHSN